MNVGNLFRSAHAFGAGFRVRHLARRGPEATRPLDTSNTHKHVPLYEYAAKDLSLQKASNWWGWNYWTAPMIRRVSRIREQAAYILGPEAGEELSPGVTRCDHVVKNSDVLRQCRGCWRAHPDV